MPRNSAFPMLNALARTFTSKAALKSLLIKMYWFSPDGALLTNQYQGLQYYNSQGQPEPGYDVRVWDLSGNPVFASSF